MSVSAHCIFSMVCDDMTVSVQCTFTMVCDDMSVSVQCTFTLISCVVCVFSAIVDLNGRYFGGRVVNGSFFNLDRFRRLDLSCPVDD